MSNAHAITIITGAGSGIGRATAIRLAAGDSVVLLDLSESGLEGTAGAIRDAGGRAETVVLDVTDRGAVQACCTDLINRHGRIDYLFSNAGKSRRCRVSEMSLDDWTFVLNIHVTGAFNLCQVVLPSMIDRQQGAIVLMSSDFGVIGFRHMANYAAAKAAVYSLAKALAVEFAAQGIRVNAVGPGPIDTPQLRNNPQELSWEDMQKSYEQRLPIGRMGRPEEVAAVVDFLLSDRSSYITGQLIQPNGGQVMW